MENKEETMTTHGGNDSPSIKGLSVPSSLLERLWVSYLSILLIGFTRESDRLCMNNFLTVTDDNYNRHSHIF
jgi:hypothetical protein